MAAAHLQLGRNAEAEEWARRALRSSPGLVQALSNLSVALLNQQRYAEAEQTAREALAADPSAAHLHSNLGSVLLHQKRFDEAEAACREALKLQPDYPEADNNLGVAVQFQNRLEEAARQFESVLRARPAFAEAWTNLGTVRQAQDRNREALACFEEALRLNPAHVKSHFCHSLALLAAGRFREGFTEYEWRWKLLAEKPRAWSQPWWDGSPLAGKTILLYAEQGLGDTIQFARYASLVAGCEGRVVVECQERLLDIVRSIRGVSEVLTPGSPLPPFDVQAALMSLPRLFGTTLDSIPRRTPYIAIEPALVDRWKEMLGPPRGLRVGLAWSRQPGALERPAPVVSPGGPGPAARNPWNRILQPARGGQSRGRGARLRRMGSPGLIRKRLDGIGRRDRIGRADVLPGPGDHGGHHAGAPGGRAGPPGVDAARAGGGLALAGGARRQSVVPHHAAVSPAASGGLGCGGRPGLP